jgi:putative FmdB family regulatory protein
MPTYEYRCASCDRTIEAFQKMSDEPLAECPRCGGELRRLIGKGAGVIIKGGSTPEGGGECNRETPCCGRDQRCDKPPCGS